MPRYNVEHKGKWACFSSISDGFITEFMDESLYIEWLKEEYGQQGCISFKKSNIKSIKQCAFSISLNRTKDESMKCFLECGLPKSECEQIMYDMETDYYCPKPVANGKFKCPNCNNEVTKGQSTCNNEYCCLDFTWR